jgi:hypothetical protein
MLTVADFREFVTTSLGDDTVQKLLDDAYQSIHDRVGELGTTTAYLTGGGEFLVLPYRADPSKAITVTEWYGSSIPTEIEEDDFQLGADGVSLRRRSDGTNSAYLWPAALTEVVFTRRDDEAKRDMVARDLAKLVHDYDPLMTQETIDGYSQTRAVSGNWNYEGERESILARLDPPDVGFR